MGKIIKFKDHPEFTPNLTPKKIFKLGSFGGTYWRPIYSSITKKHYSDQHKKYKWNIPENLLSNSECCVSVNKYKVNSGTSLKNWEDNGWIVAQDPYGWVQWYCEFYYGRRSLDDERQINRWISFVSRFRARLINLIKSKKSTWDNTCISPKIRQGLQHWAYELTQQDFNQN